MKWTTRDERRMSELEKELQELQARRLEAQGAVHRVAIDLCHELDIGDRVDLAQVWLLDHADRVRDALAPFDSGVRPEPDPAPAPITPQLQIDRNGRPILPPGWGATPAP